MKSNLSILLAFLAWVAGSVIAQIREVNLTLTEGEIYFHDFSTSLFLNTNDTMKFTESHVNLVANKTYSSVISRVNFKNQIGQSQQNRNYSNVKCTLENKGFDTLISLIYERKSNDTLNTNDQAKYYIELKQLSYRFDPFNPMNISTSMLDLHSIDLAQYKIAASNCKEIILVNEFKRGLIVCESPSNGQYFVMSFCSDNSCNEQIENLRIKDYVKDANFQSIHIKKLPGINEYTYSLLVWFEGLPFLEYILLFDTMGSMQSEVFKLEYNIKNIRYYSGQLLVFDTIQAGKMLHYFVFFDFGVRRIDFQRIKSKQMANFGNFTNSYVNSVNGEIIVELLDGPMLIDMSLDRLANEFVVEYSKKIVAPEEQVASVGLRIFEMGGDYQLATVHEPNNTEKLTSFKIINRFDVVNSSSVFPFKGRSAFWKKIPGFHQLSGCAITNNTNGTFDLEILDVNMEEPFLIINSTRALNATKTLLRAPSSMESSKELGMLGSDIQSNRVLQGDKATFPYCINVTRESGGEPFERVNYGVLAEGRYKIGQKYLQLENKSLEVEITGLSSDDTYPLHKVIKGNFLAVKSIIRRSNGTELSYRNRINPLLYYQTLNSTRGVTNKDFDEAESIIAVTTNFAYTHAFDIFAYHASNQSLSIFSSQGTVLRRKKTDITKIKFDYYQLFNETVFIIHSSQGLYMYDTLNGNLKELIFDSGKCEKVLLVKHSSLDMTLWCFFNTTASAFYARDVVEGKAGIRKLAIVVDKGVNFINKTLKFNEYFPEFIFMLSKSGLLEVLKVEPSSAISLRLVSSIQLGMNRSDIQMLDFEMIDNFMMIYQTQRIGYSNKMLLLFYHMRNPILLIRTKFIEMNYKFGPDMKQTQILKIEDKKKYGISRFKYSNTPLFAIKFKYMTDFDNLLFINPKAPVSETLPFTLFSLDSNVTTLKIGKTLFTNEMHFKCSVIVYYTYWVGNQVSSYMAKLDEIDPSLKLQTIVDHNMFVVTRDNTKRDVPTSILFEGDLVTESMEDVNITINLKKSIIVSANASKGNDIRFSNEEIVIDMEHMKETRINYKTNSINATLYQLVNPWNLTFGDVAKWSYNIESLLEQTSEIVNFSTLLRDRTLAKVSDLSSSVFKTAVANCTASRRDFLVLGEGGSTDKTPIDIFLCVNAIDVVYTLRIYLKAGLREFNYTRPNNLMTTNPNFLRLQTIGNILEVVGLRKLNGRQVFTDFYLMRINISTTTNSSLELVTITRKFFAETTKDYLIRPISSNNQNYAYEYFEWSIFRTVSKSYNISLVWEYWNITNDAANSTGISFTINNKTDMRMSLNEYLYGNTSKIEIYDEFTFKVLDKNDNNYLWLLLESSDYESYILRYDRVILKNSKGVNMEPDVWRLSNPYYGFDTTYDIKVQKSNWLLTTFKVTADACNLLIYIIPPQAFEAKPTQVNTIYVKQMITLDKVTDFKIDKPFNSTGGNIVLTIEQDLTKNDPSTYKPLQILHANKSVTTISVYPWIQFSFDNIYISSSYLNLTIKGFKDKTDTKKVIIKGGNMDNLWGRFGLLMYVAVVVGIGVFCALVFYQCIRSQTHEKEQEVADDLSRKEADAEEFLLQQQMIDGIIKTVELNSASLQKSQVGAAPGWGAR